MSRVGELQQQLRRLGERIDERSLRERALIFLALVGAIYVGASQFLFTPLQREQTRLEQDLKNKRAQAALFDEKIQTYLARGGVTEVERRERLEQLQGQLRALDGSGRADKRLVPPKEMAKLVAQMLRSNARLQLRRIESLPPEVLQESAMGKNAEAKLKTATASEAIYKHGMRVEFEGEYRDIVNYLRALENMPWRMYWGEIALDAKQHPRASVTLVIYTLSLQEGWIGV